MKSHRMQITGNMRLRPEPFLITALLLSSPPVLAAEIADIRAKNPHLFHDQTGFRIERQRAPTPDDIPPPSRLIDAHQALSFMEEGAVFIDVFGAPQSRYDELEGTWLVKDPRESLPGAIWLPEVGRGSLTADMQSYLETNLERLTKGDPTRPLVVFCVADCWMSWNAAQRIAQLGYENVNWFRLGTDGWLDEGWALEPVTPVPVNVD